MGAKFFGARIERREDRALLTGRGQFTDDIELPGTLSAVFVRSSLAHARIRSIGLDAAQALPGVHGVFTIRDLPGSLSERRLPLQVPSPLLQQQWTQHALARDEACYVGEALAVIVADSRHIGEDAAELVVVDLEPLPVAADCRDAAAAGAPVAQLGAPDNIAARFPLSYGDVDGAFARAAHVVQEDFWQHRGGCHAMEGRAVLAQYAPAEDAFTVWSATQCPHLVKSMLVEMLGHDDARVRVIAPDVGGGFGPKGMIYQEEAVVPALARLLGRPVRWTEDRREHFVATTQERDQHWTVEAAIDPDGRLLAVRGRLVHDCGAYVPWGVILPYIAGTTLPGPYILPAYHLDVIAAVTNKTPTTPLRGAGRPQAVFAMERLMDRIAQRLRIDPTEIRRRNFIPPERMPYQLGLIYRDGSPVTYDSGDYPRVQAAALERADYAGFAHRQTEARTRGRLRGIGIGNYVEGTGLGPYEGATARVLPSGKIGIFTGAAPQGQGHKTILAQIAADAFGVDMDDVEVTTADTATIPIGIGTFASRIAVNAGSSVHNASGKLRGRVLALAGHLMEVSGEDLEIVDREVRIKGVPGGGMTLSALRRVANGMPGFTLPDGLQPGLEVTDYFTPRQSTYCNGTHVVEVDVDPETGHVDILRYTVAHDSGHIINPLIVDGQIQGGVAHGIGNALFELMRYDENAQPTTMTFGEYLLPMAPNVPKVDIVHIETPTPLNPLGVKGAGEGGTIPAAAAIVAAVENALAPLGVRISETPILPERLVELIDATRDRGVAG